MQRINKLECQRITNAINKIEGKLLQTIRVDEWTELTGFKYPKKFGQRFLRYYSIRPIKLLKYMRLKRIIDQLRKLSYTNFEIACQHGIPDEITLIKIVNYHVGCLPNEIKGMPDNQLKEMFEIFGSNFRK